MHDVGAPILAWCLSPSPQSAQDYCTIRRAHFLSLDAVMRCYEHIFVRMSS